MLKNKKGFTLIELIMVIVILAILAAVAVPRFIDLRVDARNTAAKGIASAIMGSATMLHAQYLVKNTIYTLGTTGGPPEGIIVGANISGGPTVAVALPAATVGSNAGQMITIGNVGGANYTITLTLNDTRGPGLVLTW